MRISQNHSRHRHAGRLLPEAIRHNACILRPSKTISEATTPYNLRYNPSENVPAPRKVALAACSRPMREIGTQVIPSPSLALAWFQCYNDGVNVPADRKAAVRPAPATRCCGQIAMPDARASSWIGPQVNRLDLFLHFHKTLIGQTHG